MSKLRRIWELFDEKSEIAGWICLALAVAGRVTDHLDQWAAIWMVALALLTLLGAQYFRGVRIGPGGVEVGRDDR